MNGIFRGIGWLVALINLGLLAWLVSHAAGHGVSKHGSFGWTYAEIVTIALMAVTIILTVLIIGLTIAAIFGYLGIRRLITDEAERAARTALLSERKQQGGDTIIPPPNAGEDSSPIADEVKDE